MEENHNRIYNQQVSKLYPERKEITEDIRTKKFHLIAVVSFPTPPYN